MGAGEGKREDVKKESNSSGGVRRLLYRAMYSELSSSSWETLAAYFSGTCSEIERAEFEQRCEVDPQLAATVARLRRAIAAAEPTYMESGVGSALERLRQGLAVNSESSYAKDSYVPSGREEMRNTLGGRGFKTQPLRQGTWYLAAGAVVCVLAAVLSQRLGLAHLGKRGGNAPVSAYVTGRGERANITLPDGNTVALNVASRLEVPADYLAGNHTLHLSGEALFDVKHQTGSPFTVIAGGGTARVLGTSFLVRHYEGDTLASVAVREGKVAVRAEAGKTMVVTAGRRLTFNRGGAMQLGNTDPGQFSFALGVLTLPSELLSDAIPELDRWYDADVRFGDSTLAVHRLAGTLPAGSLSGLMDLLQSTYDIRIVRAGRVLTLYRK